uniref:Large ribosomal subunit protein mL62 n=1 Tax=Moina brachiata TaxID=675436 RepID=A0A4Y7NLB6_9CRUS|nr:EOG090X0JCO [Moina brachiata]SVE93384.1 EOG090X0JCO [Moina brachiata]
MTFNGIILLLVNSNVSRATYSAFRSGLSLDKIYPNSKLDITTVPQPPVSKDGKFTGFIPMDKIHVSYSRSSGPGGQNVNKLSTKAEVRFNVATANWIPETIRARLAEQVRNLTTKEGDLIVKSDRTRSQHLNLADALDKLRDLIHSAAKSLEAPVVSVETLEKLRRQRERAARERLKEKRIHSMTKQARQAPTID